jgi:hypothetical protein
LSLPTAAKPFAYDYLAMQVVLGVWCQRSLLLSWLARNFVRKKHELTIVVHKFLELQSCLTMMTAEQVCIETLKLKCLMCMT